MSNAVQIAKIVEAALAGDTNKVLNYAALIAEHFDQDGDARAARIVRRSYEAEPAGNPVTLDTADTFPLNAAGGTANQFKGSIQEWPPLRYGIIKVTCGVCSQTEELGTGFITLPNQATEKGWVSYQSLGYVCSKCQKIMERNNSLATT